MHRTLGMIRGIDGCSADSGTDEEAAALAAPEEGGAKAEGPSSPNVNEDDINKLDLQLGILDLRISLVQRRVEEPGGPYRDWLECAVQIAARSFSGCVRWNVMPQELTRLADDLMRLYDEFPKRGWVTFDLTEPIVRLGLKIGTTGTVDGQCSVQDDLVWNVSLHCLFGFEQSQLPRLARDTSSRTSPCFSYSFGVQR